MNRRDIAAAVVASKCDIWHRGLNLPSLPGQQQLLGLGLSPLHASGFPLQMQLYFSPHEGSVSKKHCYHYCFALQTVVQYSSAKGKTHYLIVL